MIRKLTRHAQQRLRQRGVKGKTLDILMDYADVEIPARQGCRFLRLSSKAASALMSKGLYRAQDVDCAQHLLVLVDNAGQIVTLVKVDPRRRLYLRR
jgi:hypothetical protein